MKPTLTRRTLLFIIAAAGAFIMVVPFLYTISVAFTPFAYDISMPKLWPDHPTLENFIRAWTSSNFLRYTANSVLLSVAAPLGGILISSLTAYAFARFEFVGREFLFRLMLFTLMVPGMISLIPTFLVMRDLHLLDSRMGLLVLYWAQAIAGTTFWLRGFFAGLPRELEEAVVIDGGNRWTIYRYVAMPLARPALITTGIFTFLGTWEEFFWARMILSDETLRTLPIAIRMQQDMHATNYGLQFAFSLIAIVPPLLFFIFGQRHFIQLPGGGVKG
ncbi:MAG TPA: carbohydrate ABC transporter permease [Symbiobacteriaceae bacterium]|nr:carbohydrate ABC transporter permease [Symbiobacteriaceae bacterium]